MWWGPTMMILVNYGEFVRMYMILVEAGNFAISFVLTMIVIVVAAVITR